MRVKTAGINPGGDTERIVCRAAGRPRSLSGQGKRFGRIVEEAGPGVSNVAVGDEVIGFTHDRVSQAEFVLVESGNLVPRPKNVLWEQVAG